MPRLDDPSVLGSIRLVRMNCDTEKERFLLTNEAACII